MKNQCRNCSISIHISLQDCLTIKIIDNGEGIDGATINKIKERYEQYGLNNESGDGIGIVNVLQRLKIYSNNRFTWSIESIPYEATVITLNLQKEGGEGDEVALG
jgi:two-component system sensor histidine kinase YesM